MPFRRRRSWLVRRRGSAASASVDLISFAIQMGATIDDLIRYQYATHPELAAKPSDNALVFAAKDAKEKMLAVGAQNSIHGCAG